MVCFTGRVKRINYCSPNGDFYVATLNGDQGLVTVVGSLYGLQEGDRITVWGEKVIHPKYGEQCKVARWEKSIPFGREAVIEYLSSGIIKGIGKKRALAIVEALGENALQTIITQGAECLKNIKGINYELATQVYECVRNNLEVQQAIIALLNYGIPLKAAHKAIKRWGFGAAEVIKSNPYRLTELPSIGFLKADAIACLMGVPKESPMRVKAAVEYVLHVAAESEGHCYLPLQEIPARVLEILKVEKGQEAFVIEAIDDLIQEKKIEIFNGTRVYLSRFAAAECLVAQKIAQLIEKRYKPTLFNRVNRLIKEYEFANRITLAEKQVEAVKAVLTNGITILTGGPGTGKTETLRAIIAVYRVFSPRATIFLAAPTGRASRKMSEVTGLEAVTVHRLLGLQFGEGVHYNEDNPLDCDLLIIDEASMLDINLAARLFAAVNPSRTRVLLVGDCDQLPSVGPGNVLRDMLAAGVPAVRLEKIFRQASQSRIVLNAHRINHGHYISVYNEPESDFYFLEYDKPEIIKEVIVASVKRFMKQGYSAEDVQVLTPMKKGIIGTVNLNAILQGVINPPGPGKSEVFSNDGIFRVGDKVIQYKNSPEKGVFNGDIGQIVDINKSDCGFEVVVEFNDCRRAVYSQEDIDEIGLAYAITVHKSQGGQYKVVIMPVSTEHYIMLARNLIYTAITRAREKVVLVGTHKAMKICIYNNKIARRNTSLQEKIEIRMGHRRDNVVALAFAR